MTGMTGYAFRDFYVGDTYISTEIKTVNHRFLEVNVRLPGLLSSLELEIRNFINKHFVRGKVDVSVFIRVKELTSNIEPNVTIAKQYADSLRSLIESCGLNDEVKLSHLLHYDDVLNVENKRDFSSYLDVIKESLSENIKDVFVMKAKEGESTKKNILSILDEIRQSRDVIETYIPEMEKNIFDELHKKMNELIGEHVDQDRLLNEVGIMVSHSCVNEELERLKHHIEHFCNICEESSDIGKRLDFLCQEMHREINTLGSKVSLSKITDSVIIIKNAIEKIREQIRNIE